MTPPEIVAVSVLGIIVLAWATTFVLAGPVGKAIGRRISGERADPELRFDLEANAAELEALRGRVLDLEDRGDRVALLEERLDFAERLLAQGREQPDRVGGAS